jgi:PTH1 family peptidyl-tRNA hydrolase
LKLVVGLGNPGRQYEQTRHNVGWMVLDRIADRAGWGGRGKERDAAVVVRGHYKDTDLVLAKPTTFMNLSGLAVRKLLAREHVPLGDLLVVYDDFDLPFGKLRMREAGSAGTHNGLRSIVAEMETQKFARLRVGIGEPSPDRDPKDHVLSRFGDAEKKDLNAILDAAADAVEDWALVGPGRAANRWNAWALAVPSAEAGAPGAGDAADANTVAGDDGAAEGRTPMDKDGVVRTKNGWRKLLPGTRDR